MLTRVQYINIVRFVDAPKRKFDFLAKINLLLQNMKIKFKKI